MKIYKESASWNKPTKDDMYALPGYDKLMYVARIPQYGIELSCGEVEDEFGAELSISLFEDENENIVQLAKNLPVSEDEYDFIDLNYYSEYYDSKEEMIKAIKDMPSDLESMLNNMKSDEEFGKVIERFINKYGFELH